MCFSCLRQKDSLLCTLFLQVPVSFAVHLSIAEHDLDNALDYSHHASNIPSGATVSDEADNSRAKVSAPVVKRTTCTAAKNGNHSLMAVIMNIMTGSRTKMAS